jgi:formylglycine-generating enzyme required for sulfatase activity
MKKIFIILLLLLLLNSIYAGEIYKTEIYFLPDSDEIKAGSVPELDEIFKAANQNKNSIITLKGYTNSLGEPEEEMELSIRRSNTIALFLNNKGIALSRIKSEGFGSQNLKVKKITEENRRVEVFIYTTEEDIKDKKIDINLRKFKIIVVDANDKNIVADVKVKSGLFEKEFKMNEPRVIDIPSNASVEFTISAFGYEKKNISISKDVEEKKIILNKLSEKQVNIIDLKGEPFMMGNKRSDQFANEEPVHEVLIDDFYIGMYEITQEEWNQVMDYNPSKYKDNKLPVHNITWYDAIEYCNKRSIKEGLKPCYKIDKNQRDKNNKNGKIDKYNWTVECDFNANGYRLPTEAEYEYAAKGGAKSKNYKFAGSNIINDVASNTTESKYEEAIISYVEIISKFEIYPYGSKTTVSNELNLFDMSNNIYEWCWDWYDADYYRKSPKNNPKGPDSGTERVLRGGLNKDYPEKCRVSAREKAKPFDTQVTIREIIVWTGGHSGHTINLRRSYIGLRVARSAKK